MVPLKLNVVCVNSRNVIVLSERTGSCLKVLLVRILLGRLVMCRRATLITAVVVVFVVRSESVIMLVLPSALVNDGWDG
nr:MAG TPA: hypothetical protein [Caudoviricetes sp.]